MTTLKIFFRLFSLGLITFSVLSCGKAKKAPVTFNMRAGNQRQLIPASTVSCKDRYGGVSTATVSEKYVEFEFPEIEIDKERIKELYPELNWAALAANPNKFVFNVVGINVKVDSPNITGGKIRCVVAGEELQYLYTKAGTTNPLWTPNAITYDSTYNVGADGLGNFRGTAYYIANSYEACPVKCGGIAAKAGVPFVAPVTFELIVISSLKNDDGTQTDVPYKITTTGSIQNAF